MRRFIRVVGLAEQRARIQATRETLAESTGISLSTLQRMEQGSRPGTFSTVCRLARHLGEVTIRIDRDHFRVTRTLPGERHEIGFEEFGLAVSIVAGYLGCDDLGREGLGYAHLATAAEAADAGQALQRASRDLGRIFTTTEIEPAEEELFRECAIHMLRPAMAVIRAYIRLYPTWVRSTMDSEKKQASESAELERPA